MPEDLTVALVTEIFADDAAAVLLPRLQDAARKGTDLAVLPELPMDRWAPATPEASPRDVEPPGPEGPRQRALAAAAAEAGLGVLGGAILQDPATGLRRNTALLVDRSGRLVACYEKVHMPQEPGFWEQSHYQPGTEPPRPASLADDGLVLGIQICSDINRPVGSQLLAAAGAQVILVPRATEATTWPRWRSVMRATALTCGCYVVSVNRPRAVLEPRTEDREPIAIGGPSVVVDPDGRLVVETEEPLAVARLEADRVRIARQAYPGYLTRPAGLYARAWADVAASGER
jgi:predicted amidohydrolase